ncbi:hypothetical protein [Phenylobacterium sp.]|uniref:hypothetical protein n=1 Tax=Phenylobacterium sp. TaxID=1871053 RepID=UPI0027328713|nr:hypothetical protein [Phenylobacterium sp.]MDP3853449.1 hypothetical protein [Phenylobacterium sp.]
MADLLTQAVRNNAEWCSLVCATHGAAGRFEFAAWVCRDLTPDYYPNLVTLRADCSAAQTALAQTLTDYPETLGIKDSFRTLDLAPHGFRRAIEGHWVRYAQASSPQTNLDWRPLTTVAELGRWEVAWGGDVHRGQRRVFLPAILALSSTHFLAGYFDERLVAGGIVTHADGVAGLSNIFTAPDVPDLVDAVLAEARRVADGTPLVGWRAGDTNAEVGESLGPLQVWLRERK